MVSEVLDFGLRSERQHGRRRGAGDRDVQALGNWRVWPPFRRF